MLVKLEAYYDGDYWCARGIGESVFTQGKTFEELLDNVREALALHFEDKLEAGETIQVLLLTETEVRGKATPVSPKTDFFLLPAEETKRRRELVKDVLKLRAELPPLGMTTSQLVHLARQERDWLYEG